MIPSSTAPTIDPHRPVSSSAGRVGTSRAFRWPGRRAAGLVDILVAATIFFMLLGYVAQSIWYSRRTVAYTDRVDNLRNLRIIMDTIVRDLENALEVTSPSYGTMGLAATIRDDRYATIRYMLTDDQNRIISSEDELSDDPDDLVWLVRTVDSEDPATGRRVAASCRRLHSVRFTRLGRNLVGVMVRLQPLNEGPGEERTLRLDTLVAFNRSLR